MSEGFTATPLTGLGARLVPHDWAWAADEAAWIADNWARRRAERPAIFNGRVLLACACRIDGTVCEVDLFEAAFSDFIGYKDAAFPDASVANAFAAIVPRARDGSVLLGVMGPRTVNAGQVYFACGTPDLADCRENGRVDLAGSATREFREETGLTVPPGIPETWTLLRGGGQLAFLRPVEFPEDGAALRARMERHRCAEAEPELSGFVLARHAGDIDPSRMPGFVQAYLARALPDG